MTQATHPAAAVKRRYSITEARRRLSEILRRVRAGHRITLTDRGKEVAEVVPLPADAQADDRLQQLVAAGVVVPARVQGFAGVRAIARRRGALARFLKERRQ